MRGGRRAEGAAASMLTETPSWRVVSSWPVVGSWWWTSWLAPGGELVGQRGRRLLPQSCQTLLDLLLPGDNYFHLVHVNQKMMSRPLRPVRTPSQWKDEDSRCWKLRSTTAQSHCSNIFQPLVQPSLEPGARTNINHFHFLWPLLQSITTFTFTVIIASHFHQCLYYLAQLIARYA